MRTALWFRRGGRARNEPMTLIFGRAVTSREEGIALITTELLVVSNVEQQRGWVNNGTVELVDPDCSR